MSRFECTESQRDKPSVFAEDIFSRVRLVVLVDGVPVRMEVVLRAPRGNLKAYDALQTMQDQVSTWVEGL